ncbi:MAG: hypothetical protein J7J31_02295 [Helicobacteraceae bacterium]|nr:hypothetical protein [Helicobacteraceae bacterium]
MKVAIPVDSDNTLYMQNPYTAPQFAIYRIEGDRDSLHYSIDTIIENPKHTLAKTTFANTQIDCNCLEAEVNCFDHICEHYSLLEIISGCKYLLAVKYCQNTSNALKNGGIEVFQIPTIIKQAESALKNFLIGAKYASKISNIHNGA